ncbi:MAG TPA: hypothetical protein VMD78_08135 [Candidatus Baltobacteraceae bacterium]|nr:hypothetical protein [Candidatus Baltobacteraceae bacterium]
MPQNSEPMKEFDARIVQAPMVGLFRNIDGDLSRRLKGAMTGRDKSDERITSLFLIMLRVTKNSYGAIRLLSATPSDSPKHEPEYVLAVAPIERQLLDLLFTIIDLKEDFPARAEAYELSGYRQAREIYDRHHRKYRNDPSWQSRFKELGETIANMETYLSITPAQKATPKSIERWLGPYKLAQRATKHKTIMEYLDSWFYGEVSSQAHLNAGGLTSVAGFLITDFAPEEHKHLVERYLSRYTFRHFTRSLIAVLAILHEINDSFKLDYDETLARVWTLLGGHCDEAKEVYELRYKNL